MVLCDLEIAFRFTFSPFPFIFITLYKNKDVTVPGWDGDKLKRRERGERGERGGTFKQTKLK